jgi:hypothetical protein
VSWNIDCNGAVAEVAEMGSTASHIEAVSEVAWKRTAGMPSSGPHAR